MWRPGRALFGLLLFEHAFARFVLNGHRRSEAHGNALVVEQNFGRAERAGGVDLEELGDVRDAAALDVLKQHLSVDEDVSDLLALEQFGFLLGEIAVDGGHGFRLNLGLEKVEGDLVLVVRENRGRHARLADGCGRILEVRERDGRKERDSLEFAVREEVDLAPVVVAREFDVSAAEHLPAALRAVGDAVLRLDRFDRLVVDGAVPERNRRFGMDVCGGRKKGEQKAELSDEWSPEVRIMADYFLEPIRSLIVSERRGEVRRSISAFTSLVARSVMVSCRPFLGFFMRTRRAGAEQRPTTRLVSVFWRDANRERNIRSRSRFEVMGTGRF